MRYAVVGTLRPPRREVVSTFLLHHLLLSYVFPEERWIPLLQKGAEPHGAGTLLIPLTSVQTAITGEEVRERTFHWVDGGTFLYSFGIILLCISTEWARNLISVSIPESMLLIWR